MEYKKMHRSYHPNTGGRAVPSDRLINDLGEGLFNYIGTFSEYNPIGLVENLAVYVSKETTESINQQKDFKLPGFKLQRGTNICGSNFNNNLAISFSKQDLLRIANAMDDTDQLQIAVMDHIDGVEYERNIAKVTG